MKRYITLICLSTALFFSNVCAYTESDTKTSIISIPLVEHRERLPLDFSGPFESDSIHLHYTITEHDTSEYRIGIENPDKTITYYFTPTITPEFITTTLKYRASEPLNENDATDFMNFLESNMIPLHKDYTLTTGAETWHGYLVLYQMGKEWHEYKGPGAWGPYFTKIYELRLINAKKIDNVTCLTAIDNDNGGPPPPPSSSTSAVVEHREPISPQKDLVEHAHNNTWKKQFLAKIAQLTHAPWLKKYVLAGSATIAGVTTLWLCTHEHPFQYLEIKLKAPLDNLFNRMRNTLSVFWIKKTKDLAYNF
jgi:hypothetical protein